MKTYKAEFDDEQFRIFEAGTEREAYIIAWSIQEELQSEFCEVSEYIEEK